MSETTEVIVWADVRPKAAQLHWAKANNLAINLMIHGASTDRTASRFTISSWVPDACAAIRDLGIELELTAWAQPHRDYTLQACEWLTQATVDYGARVVWWDAEEPWTKARGGMDYQAAADLIDLAGAREGVTGIGYAPKSLDPLLARADVLGPQAYSTTRPGSLSRARIPGVLAGWARRAPHAELMPALAAYSQAPNGLALAWVAAGRPKRIQVWALRHLVGRTLLAGLRRAV